MSHCKPHPADARDAARIAAAISFVVHFRKGPFETFKEPAASLDDAKGIKARLDSLHGGHGRRAMIYAISHSGVSTPVP